MKVALPKFQFRFVPSMGNVIHPGNFHPIGARRSAQMLFERATRAGMAEPGAGGNWLLVGGSGGFGSAARVVLGGTRGANTLNVSYDGIPNLESSNKVRRLGSPAYHRSVAIEAKLREHGRMAESIVGDAFDPVVRQKTIATLKERFQGKLDGLVWALAAPRGLDPRTGQAVSSALRPLNQTVRIKTFTGADEQGGPTVSEIELQPGTPEEAINTIFVMGGRIVEQWIDALLDADVLATGFTLITISYRGNPLNAGCYRDGLIGLAKADLEFHTRALDHALRARIGGRAIAIEGPAVVTEASGGIPGVPFYMANLLDVMGDQFEDPLDSMARMFREHFGEEGPKLDDSGLLRMDDRELAEPVQRAMRERFDRAQPGEPFDARLYGLFMRDYAQTRGFDIPGVDYEAEFDDETLG